MIEKSYSHMYTAVGYQVKGLNYNRLTRKIPESN